MTGRLFQSILRFLGPYFSSIYCCILKITKIMYKIRRLLYQPVDKTISVAVACLEKLPNAFLVADGARLALSISGLRHPHTTPPSQPSRLPNITDPLDPLLTTSTLLRLIRVCSSSISIFKVSKHSKQIETSAPSFRDDANPMETRCKQDVI